MSRIDDFLKYMKSDPNIPATREDLARALEAVREELDELKSRIDTVIPRSNRE